MPLYEYKCPSCNLKFELVQGIESRHSTYCPKCNTLATLQITSPAEHTVKFRGGWYENFTEQPIYIGSEKQLHKAEDEHGVKFIGGYSRRKEVNNECR